MHKKTTLLWNHGRKEKDMKTTLHLLHSTCSRCRVVFVSFSFPPCFHSRIVFLFVFHPFLVPILFIGSSLHLNNFYGNILTPCLCCFLVGGSNTELLDHSHFILHLHFICALNVVTLGTV